MFDHSLGSWVDEGCNHLFIDKKPIHEKSCLDGVYGCPRCERALRCLSDEDLKKVTDEEGQPVEVRPTTSCDWCKRDFPFREIHTRFALDESGVQYEVCGSCWSRHVRDNTEDEIPDDED